MASTLHVEIVTPERKLFEQEASFVSCPAAQGEVGILPMHEAFISTLLAGELKIKQEEAAQEHLYIIAGGYLQVKDDQVIVLADRAIEFSQINAEQAQLRLQELEAELAAMQELESEKAKALKNEQDWYKAQLHSLDRH